MLPSASDALSTVHRHWWEDVDENGFPGLPSLDELPPIDDLMYGPRSECPVCNWFEDNVCRPLMTKGNPRKSAKELADLRALAGRIPVEEHTALSLKAFAKYGIPPDAPLRRK